MDLIQIDENGLHLVFEKTEDFGCKLLHNEMSKDGIWLQSPSPIVSRPYS